MRGLALSTLLAAAIAAGTFAQQAPAREPAQPEVRFKLEINYVEVDAVVRDAQGNVMRDLRQEDFEILEDGTPQEISAFSFVDLPIERAQGPLFAPSVAPDVRSNAREFNGRLYLIVLDDLHTAPMRSQQVRAAARLFIERYLGANDLAAVVVTSGRAEASQEFTGEKRLLLQAVDKFMGRKLRSATLEKLDVYQRQRGMPRDGAANRIDDPLDFERGYQARTMLGLLRRTAEWMGGIRGRRKALVLFGEGIDYDVHNVFEARDAATILQETRDAIAAATRANVALYTVDPRGLAAAGGELIEMSAPAEDPSLRLDAAGLQEEIRLSQDSLRVLAEETGGIALVNANDFREGFSRIVEANSSYYLIGFYSTNTRRDGRFRTLTVRVRRPGLQVRARRGYVAPRGRPEAPARTAGLSPELSEALASPIPASGIPLHVFAAPFRGAAPNASVIVALEVGGSRLAFKPGPGTMTGRLELWIAAVDAQGQVKDSKPGTLDLKLRPETHQVVSRAGFRVTERLSIPPGRYQIRIGARDANTASVGTLAYDLEVPDFSKAPLSMSGLVLTSRAAASVPTLSNDDSLKAFLPGPPAARREFPARDVLSVFAEIYDTRGDTPHRVDITTTVSADGGRAVMTQSEERDSSELQGRSGGFGYRADVPLSDLPAGDYVLTVEARSRLSGVEPVRRDIPFRVGGAR